MNHLLATIHWNPNPELFNLLGISIRYYGLLWAVGILFAYLVVHYQYRDKKIGEDKFEPLFFYCFSVIFLLHISSVIIFESNKNHKMDWMKIILVIAGVGLALVNHIFHSH